MANHDKPLSIPYVFSLKVIAKSFKIPQDNIDLAPFLVLTYISLLNILYPERDLMARTACIILLIFGLGTVTGCSSRGNYGGQAYSSPSIGMNPQGSVYPADPVPTNPTNYQPTGPIANGCGCNNY